MRENGDEDLKLVEMSLQNADEEWSGGGPCNPGANGDYHTVVQSSPQCEAGSGEGVTSCVEDESWQGVWKTFVYSTVAVMCQVTFGYDVGAVSQCLEPIGEAFGLTTLEVGFVTSALNYCAAVGALAVSGLLLDRVGRRGSLVVASILLVFGGVAVAGATSYSTLVVGRLLQGLGVGASWAASGIYVTEIAQSQRRGQLVALVDVAINLGIVLGYIVAYIIDTGDVGRSLGVAPWRVAMGVSVVPPLLFALVSPWLPESPRWLVSKGRVAQANKAIHRLKASTASEASVADALDKLRRDQQRAARAAPTTGGNDGWLNALRSHRGQYAALLGVAQQATGTEAILYFAPTVLPSGNKFDAFLGNVGIGLAKFGGEVVASYLSDSPKIGRRTMMIGGNVGVALGLVVFGVLVMLPGDQTVPMILALSFIMLAFSLGPGPFTTVFVNECVPTDIRGKSSAVSCFLNRITSACVALSFLPLSKDLGAAPVFFGYAAIAAAATALYAATLPNTLGLSLEQIEAQSHHAALV